MGVSGADEAGPRGLPRGPVHNNTALYNTAIYNTALYNTVRFNTAQYSTGVVLTLGCSVGYIMPPMPPIPPMSPISPAPAPAPAGSGLSATTASVVRNRPAIDDAFCSAERVTFVGSMMPDSSRLAYSPVAAFRP